MSECCFDETETRAYQISPPAQEAAYAALGLPSFCGCEVCEAGGSCIAEPFATTMEDLVERIEWRNVAAALKGLGLVVTRAKERSPAAEPAEIDIAEALDRGWTPPGWRKVAEPEDEEEAPITAARLYGDVDEAVVELMAKGASRHQIRRFRNKIWDAMATDLGVYPNDPEDPEAVVRKDAYTRFMAKLCDEVLALKARIRVRHGGPRREATGITTAKRGLH